MNPNDLSATSSAAPPRRRQTNTAQAAVDAHRPDDGSQLFGISELCQEFGITLRTIRFYEAKGLLAPRRVGGTRVYGRRDRARLALILRSKSIGASLAQIKHYLDLYGAHGEGRVKQLTWVRERTDLTIRELDQRREQIEATLAELRLINAEVRHKLEQS